LDVKYLRCVNRIISVSSRLEKLMKIFITVSNYLKNDNVTRANRLNAFYNIRKDMAKSWLIIIIDRKKKLTGCENYRKLQI